MESDPEAANILFQITILVILTLINAFFAGSEMAVAQNQCLEHRHEAEFLLIRENPWVYFSHPQNKMVVFDYS